MYHDIAAAAPRAGGGPERFAVPFAEYCRQLDQLRAEGYAVCSLRQALSGEAGRIVAVTFDDGDAGQYEHGYRALVERGMSATFFVTTDWIGRTGFVTWDQLREMRAAGMEIEAHARTHRFLSELGADELREELRGAKAALDDGLGQETDMLALPGGAWPARGHRHLIAEAGYRVVATSRWGVNTVRGQGGGFRQVRRCTVSGVAGVETFRKIASGDAWLAGRRAVREGILGALRSGLGPNRYARWRRRFLDAFPR